MTNDDNLNCEFTIERFDDSIAIRPSKWFGAGRNPGTAYVVKRNGDFIWSVGIDYGEASHVPFREELFWEATRTVVIGGGSAVYIFEADSGELQTTLPVPSLFGHLALITIPSSSDAIDDVLLVMGWRDVHLVDSRLNIRWVARDVAIDGIIFSELRDNAIIACAEMDPPGGWVEVALDALTGAELWRKT